MSLVGFDHVFETAQPVPFAPDLALKVIPPTTQMLLKIVGYMDDQQRRAKDLEDIRGLLAEYAADSERVFSTSSSILSLKTISHLLFGGSGLTCTEQ